ncbi:acyltransferase domain-containing protein, partial [Kitasatospora sp. NPDC127059]|uniref:acyltransferase domain-containing protein n=1 Tax=Kitasatospora sp. NPDC127059 TaxID=3347120 RepID=UPI0036672592
MSAKTPTALRDHARRLTEHLHHHPHLTPQAVADTLDTRTPHHHRAATYGTTRTELLDALTALANDQPHPRLLQATTTPGKTVFVFPGQGSQWPGMGLELLNTSPVFAHHLHACAQALHPHTDWSLLDVLHGNPDAPDLNRVDVIQPALFALMVSLARTWQHHGIHPHAVIGHSQGEIAAAHIAGALTLNDAARIITLRSQALLTIAGTGAMASIPLPPDQITLPPGLTIAAHNSPHTTVISGDPTTLHTLTTHYQHQGIDAKIIPVDYASHSHHVEPLRDHLLTTLADLQPTTPTIPFHSTTHPGTTPTLNAHYWYDNLRHPVHLHTVTQNLLTTGHTHFIETSPHPVLTTPIQQTADTTNTTAHTTGTLRRNTPETTQLTHALAHTWTHNTPTTTTTK